jgi:D-arabinose 1-dehydrogenase-like Zn-dependent alcohol dehydrogenase
MRLLIAVAFAAIYTPVWAAMPAAEQNALVMKYCAVCHTDASMKPGDSRGRVSAGKERDLAE